MVYLYTNGSVALPSLLLLALFVMIFFGDWVPRTQLNAWFFALLTTLLLRALHLWWRKRRNTVSHSWLEHEYFIGSTITAILWGMGILMFMSHLPVILRMVLLLFSCMYVAAAGVLLLSSVRCYYGVIIPVFAALLLELGYRHDDQSSAVICAILSLGFFISLIRRRMVRWQMEGLYHRYTNAHMALELRKTSEYLRQVSQLDGLTSIANRARFDKALESAWRRCGRAQAPLSLILLDVDFFKQFNDKYGHQAGDECLRRVAGLLSQALRREDDLAARYGGEEFVLLLPFTDLIGAQRVASTVQKALAELAIPHKKSQVNPFVTCSMGIATLVPCMELVRSELVEMADVALYRAKKNGRNRVEVAD